jgi:hypothetical protein
MFDRRQALGHRVISGVDLLIDLATLGEYGIEPIPADGLCGERTGRAAKSRRAAGREALPQARRGACRPRRPSASRPRPDLELWYR